MTKDAIIPFYPKPESMPEIGVQFQKQGPFIPLVGPIAGVSVTIKLPPGAGFLYNASVACELSVAGDLTADDVACQVGLTSVRQLDWLANGQPLLSQTGTALRCLVKTLPVAEQAFVNRYSFPLKRASEESAVAALEADRLFLTYIPLIATWLSEPQKAWLLNVIGDLQLRVTFDTTVMTGFSQAITMTNSTLYCDTYMPKLSVYNQMVVNDWSKSLVMSCFNTFTEPVVFTSTTGVSNYIITCPFLVYRTHIFARNTAAAPGVEVLVRTVSMDVGGVKFIDDYPKSRLMSLKAKSGLATLDAVNSDLIQSDNFETPIIDYAVYSGRNENMGTAFFQELRGSKISVVTDTIVGPANHTLFLVHEYWNNIEFSPGMSGSGSVKVLQNS